MKQVLIVVITLLFFSCQSGEDKSAESLKMISILEKDNDTLPFHSIFSKVEISPLETNASSLINYVGKFSVTNGRCYVLDDRQQALLVFNSDVGFQYKIQQVGKGPGEYQAITDFNVDLASNKISLLAPQGIIFNYDTLGVFKSKIKLPKGIIAAHYFEYLDSTTVAVYNHFKDLRISICDLKLDTILSKYMQGQTLLTEKEIGYIARQSPLIRKGGKIYYLNYTTGQIYILDKKGAHALAGLGMDMAVSDNVGMEKHPHLKNTFVMRDMHNYTAQYPFFFNFAMSDKKIFGSYTYKKRRRSFIYDLDKKTYQPCSKFKEGVYPLVDFMEGNKAYAIANPEHINYYVNQHVLDKKNYEKLKAIKATSNPILIKYTFIKP